MIYLRIDQMSKSQQVYELLKKGMDASTLRSKVISNNIANVNTKGFKRSVVNFEDSLKENMDKLSLKVEDEKHIDTGSKYGEIDVEQDTSSSMRADGNNIDVDLEKTNQAANTLMYYMLENQVNNRISTERYIISGR